MRQQHYFRDPGHAQRALDWRNNGSGGSVSVVSAAYAARRYDGMSEISYGELVNRTKANWRHDVSDAVSHYWNGESRDDWAELLAK